jgi:cytochrome c peroxidase
VRTCAAEPDPDNYGLDPIFRTVDGSNSPLAQVDTAAEREAAYSMLLSKALIRVGIGIPADADFELAAVDDPYGFASAAELSLFRRPLPATNLRLSPLDGEPGVPILTGVMWDGRVARPGHDIIGDLLDQANGATMGHAQSTAGLSEAEREAILAFETGLHTAQVYDAVAGNLRAVGGHGGPDWLAANQDFYLGINDVLLGDYQTGAPFDPRAFTIYQAWAGSTSGARRRIARGQEVFNSKPIAISGVKGLNDVLGMEVIPGTCTSCHDAPNYGHHSVKFPINIGIADAERRTPDMPLYTLRNKNTGETIDTTDPGRALVTGRWRDIGKFKGPILRGLAARPPYFHNGMAATVEDVIEFYDARFGIGLTAAEKADLAAFLLAL